MTNKYKILTVIGARPQFVKAAIVSRALAQKNLASSITEVTVHTGQHYDQNLSDVFFKELGMRAPDYNLEVGSGKPGSQLSLMLSGLESVYEKENPDAILVYGDTNSTLAACIIANQMDIAVVHVEAGERIYRRHKVPEERNRVAVDHLSDLCLASTEKASLYLRQEGISNQRVRYVGDPMWDLFQWGNKKLDEMDTTDLQSYGIEAGKYILATIHRAENTNARRIRELFSVFSQTKLPVLLPAHPRLLKIIKQEGLSEENVIVVEPQGYFEFLNLLKNCDKVLTDSGGVTREAFFAKKLSVVPMENSWWKEISESGWSVCVAEAGDRLVEILNSQNDNKFYPEGLFGDGNSSEKIWNEIVNYLENKTPEGNWHRLGSVTDLPKTEESTFSYANYRLLLQSFLDKGYRCESFTSDKLNIDDKPGLLLRHDIDLSLEKALAMAKIESEMGISSTYFIMVSSPFYNIFTRSAQKTLEEIFKMGHRLGLHFDCAAHRDGLGVDDLNQLVQFEAGVLEKLTGKKVEIVSFHRPNQLVLQGSFDITAPLEHTYMSKFTRDIEYCSDSRGRWGHGSPFEREAYRKKRSMHLLIHPVWWNTIPKAPFSTLERFIANVHLHDETELANNCEPYRFWLKEES